MCCLRCATRPPRFCVQVPVRVYHASLLASHCPLTSDTCCVMQALPGLFPLRNMRVSFCPSGYRTCTLTEDALAVIARQTCIMCTTEVISLCAFATLDGLLIPCARIWVQSPTLVQHAVAAMPSPSWAHGTCASPLASVIVPHASIGTVPRCAGPTARARNPLSHQCERRPVSSLHAHPGRSR